MVGGERGSAASTMYATQTRPITPASTFWEAGNPAAAQETGNSVRADDEWRAVAYLSESLTT